ncbi:hypothetical protein NQZ68_018025 [Dissostichus eleginoides]|nr:hypothetical protein NQZ68_018025 [Dissostichus eleginoides]
MPRPGDASAEDINCDDCGQEVSDMVLRCEKIERRHLLYILSQSRPDPLSDISGRLGPRSH